MKTIIFALSLILTVSGLTELEKWDNFKVEYGKSYVNHLEENLRFNIFMKNLQKISEHNEKYYNGEKTYKLGINQFADMTSEEYRTFLGYQKRSKPVFDTKTHYFHPDSSPIPEFVNWTDKGAVTNVKNQGKCGSCWSFSAVGSLEGQYFRKTGQLVSLSAQNLVDCDTTCYGCFGGLMDRAFKYIEENGISTDKDYPYRGVADKCESNATSSFLKITSYSFVKENSEVDLQKAVASIGPISVAIDAASDGFQFYESGVLDDDMCQNTREDLNHGVLAVGYGTENGTDFWLVKNSWSTAWGHYGYIKMSRNKDNQCGIATQPVFPIL